jgi:hypothetical protein
MGRLSADARDTLPQICPNLRALLQSLSQGPALPPEDHIHSIHLFCCCPECRKSNSRCCRLWWTPRSRTGTFRLTLPLFSLPKVPAMDLRHHLPGQRGTLSVTANRMTFSYLHTNPLRKKCRGLYYKRLWDRWLGVTNYSVTGRTDRP